ncbi:MAG: hypothetical protein ACFE9T_14980 [Promethearchaeota archaeon]
MREKRKKMGLFIILLIGFSFIFQTNFLDFEDNSITENNLEDIDHSSVSEVTRTRQWIKNGNFSSSDYWTPTKGDSGDPEDVDASISGGTANYTINGELGKYSISGTPNSTWTAYNNTDWGVGMDEGTERGIGNYGCWVSYTWDENDDQTGGTPSVHWKRNITLPIDMADYKITSAFLNVTFNATVTPTGYGAIDVLGDTANIDDIQVGDYARFYFLISDIENVYQPFQLAINRTKYLGSDTGPVSTIGTTSLTNIDDTLLINYLELILGVNSTTFTMTLGLDLFCEDNIAGTDVDRWDKLRINFINLTFTYEKRIDDQTSVSWNQEGDIPSDIISNPFVINEAILNFTYKVNDTLPKELSPNSELQILINNIPHSETIKLWTAETTFKNASINGFDVTRLIDKDQNINVSVQLYLADDFELNRTITFSIDDIYLNVTYTEEVTDIETKIHLFLNNMEKTEDPFISLPLGEELNITVKYTNLTGDYISGATITLEGKANGTFDPDPSFNQYNLTINTNDLGIGVSVLTVIAQKPFYETNQTQFLVEVTERETELLLFLDGVQKNHSDTIDVRVDTPVNITVSFRDNETKQRLPDATVTLLGWDELNETNDHYYNITINTKDLDLGINSFTIFAQLVNYTTNSISFFIDVFERETKYQLLLNDKDLTLNPFINITIIDTLNITVKYLDNETENHIINATLEYIEIGGELTGNLTEYETLEFYSEEINATDLGIGVSIINIIAQKTLYQTQNIQFSVEITERETELLLYVDGDLTEDGATIEAEIDDLINITIYYTDNVTTEHIPNATVELLDWGKLNETNNQYYNITIDARDLEQGITIFTIFAQKENYQPQIIRFFIGVTERETEIILYIDGDLTEDGATIEADIDDLINITIYYKDNVTKEHLPNATVELLNWGMLNETNNEYYNITIDAKDLEQGITIFTIFAQKENYQPQIINFFIEVTERETEILLFINGDLTDNGATVQVEIDDLINITIYYKDNVTKEHLPNATVELLNWGMLNETNNEYYNITIDAKDLEQGITIFTIFAQKENYQPQIINFFIEVTERETEISLFINSNPINNSAKVQVEIDDLINITIYFKDNVTKTHIPNAIVELLYWDYLNETNNQYNILINASDLTQVFTALTVFAQKENYQPRIINFFIEVVEKETSLQLFINGDPTDNGDTIQVEFDDIITIIVYYKDNATSQHIPNAFVELLNWGILNETTNQYNILINASDLTQVITALTVFARKENYQQQLINFFIEVVEKETSLQLFINGDPTDDSDTIQVEFDDTITIIVYYRDNATSQHIPNAVINLLGVGNLNESINQYSILINANDLEQGINAFTITAEMDYYQSQSIRFFVELVEKATLMQLILNSVDKTSDPIFNLTIGQSLNLTVKYTDQNGVFIPNATVLLIKEGLSLELMKDNTLDQYYRILDTSELGIGVKLFSILIQKPNYQSITKDLRIIVNRISADITTISGEAQIEAEIGDDVVLQIILNDTIFGADIPNATIAFNWLYDQGESEDSDGDGIYEILLENVREGVHTITITAFAGDNYYFESYEITLIVNRPTARAGPDLSWLIFILTGGIVGLVIAFTLYQTHYKYPPMVRKIRKLRKKIRKDKRIKPILLGKREDIIKKEFQNQINVIEMESKQVEEKILKVENNQNLNKSEL